MRLEIKSASNFLANLLRLGNGLEGNQLELFRCTLEDLLRHHYQQHWFPEKPFKGSGYRCLRINHKMDPILAKAGFACGLNEASLRQLFPNELTMWVDPKEVSYRIGENGSICVLFDGSKFSTTSSNSNNTGNSVPLPPIPRSSCKDSLRGNHSWDSFIMDPRNVNLEQLAAYVSS